MQSIFGSSEQEEARALVVKPLDFRIHSALLIPLAFCGLFSVVKVNNTINAWNMARAEDGAHSRQVAEVERQADLTQSKIDNRVNVFDSVTLTDYTCDPDNPPQFEVGPFIDPDQPVNVADMNQRVIGYIEPSGTFVFLPNNCRG